MKTKTRITKGPIKTTVKTTVMEKSGEYTGDVLIAEDEEQNFGYSEVTRMKAQDQTWKK